MIFYSWTALKKNDREPAGATAMGITDDRGRAMNAGEEALGSGRASVVVIEAVRLATAASTLAPCYVRTGVGWLGWRTPAGEVAWHRFFVRSDPDDQTGLAGLGHETPDLH